MRLMKKSLIASAVAATLSAGAMSLPTTAAAGELSGNIGVVSQYILRGITSAPESDVPAVQGGLDYGFDSGFYIGYWGSSLNYLAKAAEADDPAKSFEHDFYGGYAGEISGFSYDVGLIQYVYQPGEDVNAAEVAASVGYGPVALGMKYLTKDVLWGNQGDIYWTLSGETDIPGGFTLSGVAGYYTYKKDGEFIPETADSESSAFRHLDVSLSHPLGATGADMSLTYIMGGKDRVGGDQGDTFVAGLSYGF
jgi:uncharacterized protein (TIGR02001 family)